MNVKFSLATGMIFKLKKMREKKRKESVEK